MVSPPSRWGTRTAPIRIAMVGCCHGDLGIIDDTVRYENTRAAAAVPPEPPIELVFLCGDFEAIRGADDERDGLHDMGDMKCPAKYQHLGGYFDVYHGVHQLAATYIAIGGNHEASGHMAELFYGGWVAPQIYYLGAAGAIRYGPLRIFGQSGIFNEGSYGAPHHARGPMEHVGEQATSFYQRAEDEFKLQMLTPARHPRVLGDGTISIGMSHDWPKAISDDRMQGQRGVLGQEDSIDGPIAPRAPLVYGRLDKLLRDRPRFRRDVQSGGFGSPCAWRLLCGLQPHYWLSGHMHYLYGAVVDHPVAEGETHGAQTAFVAASKPLVGQDYFKVIDIVRPSHDVASGEGGEQEGVPYGYHIEYDAEWLAIIRRIHPHLWFPVSQPKERDWMFRCGGSHQYADIMRDPVQPSEVAATVAAFLGAGGREVPGLVQGWLDSIREQGDASNGYMVQPPRGTLKPSGFERTNGKTQWMEVRDRIDVRGQPVHVWDTLPWSTEYTPPKVVTGNDGERIKCNGVHPQTTALLQRLQLATPFPLSSPCEYARDAARPVDAAMATSETASARASAESVKNEDEIDV